MMTCSTRIAIRMNTACRNDFDSVEINSPMAIDASGNRTANNSSPAGDGNTGSCGGRGLISRYRHVDDSPKMMAGGAQVMARARIMEAADIDQRDSRSMTSRSSTMEANDWAIEKNVRQTISAIRTAL